MARRGRHAHPANGTAGIAVREAREASGLTLQQLAELTGVNKAHLSEIERGVNSPSVSTLERIADGLGGQLDIVFRRVQGARNGRQKSRK